MSNIRDEYEDLINLESIINDAILKPEDHSSYNLEDDEDFVTSKEIVKMEEIRKKEHDGLEPARGPIEIEETMEFKRYTKAREHKYTKSEMDAIIESCKCTIVHDYGYRDYYHISDEERSKIDSLNEMRVKLGSIKRIHYNPASYVEAMRIVLEAWKILEKNDNFLHSKKEFFKMISNGEIYNSSIIMPKLKYASRYNIDELAKYILNPELDPKDLLTENQKRRLNGNDWYIEEDIYNNQCILCGEEIPSCYDNEEISIEAMHDHILTKHPELAEEFKDIETKSLKEQYQIIDKYFKSYEEQEIERLLTPDEIDSVLSLDKDNIPTMKVEMVQPSMFKGYKSNRSLFGHKKKNKNKHNNSSKQIVKDSFHKMLRMIENDPSNYPDEYGSNASYMFMNSLFEEEKEEKSPMDNIRFTGSWTDKTDLLLYDLAMEEAMLREHPEGSKYQTYGDLQLAEFFKTMEDNGWNVLELRRSMNMTHEDIKKSEIKRVKKTNKKKEAAVLQRIIKLNGDPKFKKLINKAEKQINNQTKEYE